MRRCIELILRFKKAYTVFFYIIYNVIFEINAYLKFFIDTHIIENLSNSVLVMVPMNLKKIFHTF